MSSLSADMVAEVAAHDPTHEFAVVVADAEVTVVEEKIVMQNVIKIVLRRTRREMDLRRCRAAVLGCGQEDDAARLPWRRCPRCSL